VLDQECTDLSCVCRRGGSSTRRSDRKSSSPGRLTTIIRKFWKGVRRLMGQPKEANDDVSSHVVSQDGSPINEIISRVAYGRNR
jgi:hypothetical protein